MLRRCSREGAIAKREVAKFIFQPGRTQSSRRETVGATALNGDNGWNYLRQRSQRTCGPT